MNPNQENIKKYSENFITNTTEPMPTVRRLLTKKNIDLEKLIVVQAFPDDTNLLFFIVIDCNKKIYQFEYDYLHKKVDEGEIVRFEDISDSYESTPYRKGILTGLEMLS